MGRGKAAGDGTCRRLRTECGEDCDVRESSGGEEEGGTEAAQAGGMARAKLRNSPSESNSHVKTVPPARTEDVHGVSPLLPARRMGSLGSDVGQRYCRTAVVRGAAGGAAPFICSMRGEGLVPPRAGGVRDQILLIAVLKSHASSKVVL